MMNPGIDKFWEDTLEERFPLKRRGGGPKSTSIKEMSIVTTISGSDVAQRDDTRFPMITRTLDLPFYPLTCRTDQVYTTSFPVSVILSVNRSRIAEDVKLQYIGLALHLAGGRIAVALQEEEMWWPVIREIDIMDAGKAAIAGPLLLGEFALPLLDQFYTWEKIGDLWAPPSADSGPTPGFGR